MRCASALASRRAGDAALGSLASCPSHARRAYAPIVNLHYAASRPRPGALPRLLDALCQWVLVRPAGVSVTVSAGDEAAREDQDSLAARAWAELREAALAFGLAGDWPEQAPPCRV
jgi:hypothetical protein